MRLFVALDIDDNIRANITRFLDRVRDLAPGARWSPAESLHVTLKFIGERREEAVQDIKRRLETIEASAFELDFRGCGFFPDTRAPRVFWAGIESGSKLASLAASVADNLARAGIPNEEHPYNPHLTLARAAGRSARKSSDDGSKRTFHRLQEELAAQPVPGFGRMRAREFFLYQSRLSPSGSKYTKLARFAMR